MKGWLNRENKTLGWVNIDGCKVQLKAPGIGDSHPQGWFGHTILTAPLHPYISLPQHLCPNLRTATTSLVVLLVRYVDKVYVGILGFSNNSPQVAPLLDLIKHLHGRSMKWETVGAVTD